MVGFGYIREGSQFPKTYYNYNVFNVVMVVLRKILNFTHLFLLNVCFLSWVFLKELFHMQVYLISF